MAAAYIDLYKVFEPFRHDVTKASKAVFKIKVCTFVVLSLSFTHFLLVSPSVPQDD